MVDRKPGRELKPVPGILYLLAGAGATALIRSRWRLFLRLNRRTPYRLMLNKPS